MVTIKQRLSPNPWELLTQAMSPGFSRGGVSRASSTGAGNEGCGRPLGLISVTVPVAPTTRGPGKPSRNHAGSFCHSEPPPRQRVSRGSHSPSGRRCPAQQADPVQALLAPGDPELPNGAGHHSVLHLAGHVHLPSDLRKHLKRVRMCVGESGSLLQLNGNPCV